MKSPWLIKHYQAVSLGEWLCNYRGVHGAAMHLSFIKSFSVLRLWFMKFHYLYGNFLKVCSYQQSPFTLYKQEYLIHQFININLDVCFSKGQLSSWRESNGVWVTQENQRNAELTEVRSGDKQRPHTHHSLIIFSLILLNRSCTAMVSYVMQTLKKQAPSQLYKTEV